MKIKKQRKGKLKLIDKIILVVTILCSVALLLSYLAPTTDPRDYWVIALLGFGYQVLLLVEIAFLLYWLIRWNLIAILPAASILLGFSVFSLHFKFHEAGFTGKKQDSTNIRVMEFNVNQFKGVGKFEGLSNLGSVMDLIDEKQPDIITFIEYYKTKTTVDSLGELFNKKFKYNYYSRLYSKVSNANDSFGNAVFSKYPIVSGGFVESPKGLGVEAAYVDVRYKDSIFRVYSIHLKSIGVGKTKDKYRYLTSNLGVEKSNFIITKLKLAFIERSYQVARIKRHLEACPYPFIIAGDFDDTPASFSVNEISDGMKNAFAEKGGGLGKTFYSKFPILQVDYILATSQFDILSYEAIDKKISDHMPVVSDLRLK